MRVLHVVAGLNENGGGTSEVIPRMCEELVKKGHQVTLLTVEYGNLSMAAREAMTYGVKLVVCKKSKHHLAKLVSYSSELSEMAAYLVRDVDIIHLHCLWEWPCWRIAHEARRQHKPYVIQTHGFLEPERLKKSWFRKFLIGTFIEKRNLSRARCVIATAPSEERSLRKYGIRNKIAVIPIGIDISGIDTARKDINILRRLGTPAGKKVLLYLSRLAPIKGLDMLAEAWRQLEKYHSQWQLLIVGDDLQGYSVEIKKYYSRCILDNSVSFPGPIYGKEKYVLLKSVDAFVLPTRSENFSIAVQEALAAGLPVVCTKGAPWSVISDEGAGEWVDISVTGIKDGIERVINYSDDEKRRVSVAARNIIRRDFSWDSVLSHLLYIYKTTMCQNRLP